MIIVIIINNGFSGKAAELSLVVKEYFPYTVALSLCYNTVSIGVPKLLDRCGVKCIYIFLSDTSFTYFILE